MSINQERNQENQGSNQSHHNQRRLSIGQVQMFAQVLSYVLFYSFFCLFVIFLIRSLSLNPSSSPLSNSSSVSSEKSVDSALTSHSLISKLAAVKASLAVSFHHGYLNSRRFSSQCSGKPHEDSRAQHSCVRPCRQDVNISGECSIVP